MSDLLALYRGRGWSLVPVRLGKKHPWLPEWQIHTFGPEDFSPGGNVAAILGPRSGELVDVDLDCSEALALADHYLPETDAIFGRASKPRSHRLFISSGSVYENFVDPLAGKADKATLLELRARGATGGEHLTLIPPSIADGERREWLGEAIAPAVFDATKLRWRCTWLAIACLVARYVSHYAAERPEHDFLDLLWDQDPALGRVAHHWVGLPDPTAPKPPRRQFTRAEINLAEVVDAIPNNVDWIGWNRIGLAIFAASHGSDQGGNIFASFSARHPKYNPASTAERWQHYRRSPPTRIGVGTLIFLARRSS